MASCRTLLKRIINQGTSVSWARQSAAYRKTLSNSSDSASSSNSINISSDCAKQLKSVTETPNTMLRVTVDGGGCSGFQYKFNLDNKLNKDDRVFERDGVKVVVDELSLGFLSGATIDYHQELIRSSFQIIDNPNAEQGCSCGVSFALK